MLQVGVAGQLGPGADGQLPVDPGQHRFDRFLRDVETTCDLSVGDACGCELCHRTLGRGELAAGGHGRRPLELLERLGLPTPRHRRSRTGRGRGPGRHARALSACAGAARRHGPAACARARAGCRAARTAEATRRGLPAPRPGRPRPRATRLGSVRRAPCWSPARAGLPIFSSSSTIADASARRPAPTSASTASPCQTTRLGWRQPIHAVRVGTHCHEHRHAVRRQPAQDEGDRRPGRSVDPWEVVEHEQQASLNGELLHHPQDSEVEREQVGRGAGRSAEQRHVERVLQVVRQLDAGCDVLADEVVQAHEGQAGLRDGARGPPDDEPGARCVLGHLADQRRLPDPGDTDHGHAAAALAGDHLQGLRQLGVTAEERARAGAHLHTPGTGNIAPACRAPVAVSRPRQNADEWSPSEPRLAPAEKLDHHRRHHVRHLARGCIRRPERGERTRSFRRADRVYRRAARQPQRVAARTGPGAASSPSASCCALIAAPDAHYPSGERRQSLGGGVAVRAGDEAQVLRFAQGVTSGA